MPSDKGADRGESERATPKSMIRALPSWSIMMLWGLRSMK
jgi:hypothetical protein